MAEPVELPYGELPDQIADVWRYGHGGSTAIVVLHGGFWLAEWDRRSTYRMCAALAEDGDTVATIEYRRVGQPGGGWPGTFDDVALAVDRMPELLGVERVVLVGHSAGGHLALWAAARHRQPPESPWRLGARPPIAGVVSLAGVCDLAQAARLELYHGAAANLLGGEVSDDRLAAADPARLTGGGVPATLLHGDADDLVPLSLSQDYATAAQAAGDPVDLQILPGVGHFDVIDPRSACWPAVVDAVRRARERR